MLNPRRESGTYKGGGDGGGRTIEPSHRILTEREIPVTVYAVGRALELNPKAGLAMKAAGWEVASHGYRWIDYQYVSEETEREHIRKAVAVHEKVLPG